MKPEEAKELLEQVEVLDDPDMEEAHKVAIKELENAIPKKPVIKHTDAWIADTYYCPVCNNRLEKGLHCNKCRQAIKWED